MEVAWPGAHTRTSPASPPIPAPGTGQHRLIVGGQLRLARPEALPLRTGFDADSLRALLAAPAGLGAGQRSSQYETLIRYALATLLPRSCSAADVRTARAVARGLCR